MFWKNTVAPELLGTIQNLQKKTLFKDYTLSGGTALSLQLGHRISNDIDMFTTNKQDNEILKKFFDENYTGYEELYNGPGIYQIIVNNIKIDMVSIRGKTLEIPKTEEEITFFGIKDIAAMKLSAITDRKKAKDYIDIAYLLKEMKIKDMFNLYKEKYDKTDIFNVKKALTESSLVDPYSWEKVIMIKHDIFISDIPKIIKAELVAYNKSYDIAADNFLQKIFKKLRR